MSDIYPAKLASEFGTIWKRFWFTQASDRLTAQMRIAVGVICLVWLYSFSTDVGALFGPNGIVNTQAVHNIEAASLVTDSPSDWRFSILDYCTTDSQVSTVHIIAFALVAAFTIGFATPFTSVASLILVSSFVQRAPILFGATEHLLLLALLYLCIAPCGRLLSLDAFLKKRNPTELLAEERSVRSNICLRLIQLHVAMILLYSGLTKLSGIVWWNGEAVWWILVQPESALVDFSSLGGSLLGELTMNAWTYCIVIVELLAATFIWFRLARPLIMGLAILVYLSLILLTGLVGYGVLMIVLLFAFLHHSEQTVLPCKI